MVTFSLFFFFFQAEDGIRDLTVTGVQTCALPISGLAGGVWVRLASRSDDGRRVGDHGPLPGSPGGGHEALRVRVDRRLAGPLPGLLCLAGRRAQLRQAAEALLLLAE